MVLAELQFSWFLVRFNFLGYHLGRGLFHIFVGTLTFAVFGMDGVISIILMIIGIIVIVVGVVQIVIHFFGHRIPGGFTFTSESSATGYEVEYGNTSSAFDTKDLEDRNFDPNAYGVAGGIDISKSYSADTYGAPQAGSLSDYGLKAPTYDEI
jgi:hypothetical protein